MELLPKESRPTEADVDEKCEADEPVETLRVSSPYGRIAPLGDREGEGEDCRKEGRSLTSSVDCMVAGSCAISPEYVDIQADCRCLSF